MRAAVVLLGLLTAAPIDETRPARDPAAPTAPLELVIFTRSDDGHVYCALWPSSDGYPTVRARALFDGRATQIVEGRARIRLEPTLGPWAAACFHDENANQRLDTNFFGIPSEGTGATNNARGFMGPPSFEDARFVLTTTASLGLKMDYF